MKTLTLNPKKIAVKQLIAFVIDMAIVSLPLVLMTNLTGYAIFTLLWVFYIPMAELIYSQTLGMKIVDTRIYSNTTALQKISIGTALRRHIARISIFWGVVGWFLMLIGKQYVSDYVIADEKYHSISFDEDGLITAHQNNQYKVIFFLFVLMAVFSVMQNSW